MTYIRKNDYVPITVAFKKKYGKKICIRTFTDLACPDKLLTVRGTRLPEGCEILEVGWGRRYEAKYKKKYG